MFRDSPNLVSPPRGSGRRCAAMLLLLLCLSAMASAQAPTSVKSLLGVIQQDKKTPSNPLPTPPAVSSSPPAAIPLPDVAARSEELKRMLREVSDRLPTGDDLAAATATLNERDDQLQTRQRTVDGLLAATPTAMELREEENYWRAKQKDTAETRVQLLGWANAAQAGVQQLQAQQPVWAATLEQNQATPDLGPTLDVIQKAVHDLQKLTARAQEQLRTIVNLQIRAADQDQLALDELGRIEKTRQYLDSRLFQRDSLPLWQIGQRRELGENKQAFTSASSRWLGIRAFAAQAKGGIVLLVIVLVLSLIAAYRLHLKAGSLQVASEAQEQVSHIASHWIALGVLPALLLAYLLAPLAPLALIGLVILVSFVPILILLPPLIQPRFRLLLYCIAGVYSINALIAWMSLSPVHKREAQFLSNLLIFGLFAFLVRPKRISSIREGGRAHWLRLFGIRLAVLLLGVSLLTNLFGYLKLAQFLGLVCLYSTFIAISMLTGVRVFTLLLLASVDTPAAQQLALIRQYRDPVVRWVPRAFQWVGVLIWLFATVNLMGLSDWIGAVISEIVRFRIAGGSVGVTFGGVVGFFLILLGGYAISSAIRFLVREELLSRFHMARGVPELISSMLHYLLLLLVFFFAINAGGVELNKFTVLTGALGVGVGFGLQNIVNNFISGLILQFERPIHIGDVLDVDRYTGKVTRIGIRSSTLRTFQGAEVIIPNGNFISGTVINWTLSESLRRVELPVGVAYGSDAQLVSTLMEQAATAHETVLTSPSPVVYFKEFGESSLNFELQFWVMQESNWVKVKSDVALTIMDLLNRANVEIPFPQRDLRLRSVDATAAATLLAPDTARNGSNGDDQVAGIIVQDDRTTGKI